MRAARRLAGGVPLTGFSLGGSARRWPAAIIWRSRTSARALRADGLEAVAEAPLDRLGDTENAIEVVRAVAHGGLGAWRATVASAPIDRRGSI